MYHQLLGSRYLTVSNPNSLCELHIRCWCRWRLPLEQLEQRQLEERPLVRLQLLLVRARAPVPLVGVLVHNHNTRKYRIASFPLGKDPSCHTLEDPCKCKIRRRHCKLQYQRGYTPE